MGDKRICIIGAGPSGMATLFHFAKLEDMPDVVCFEKQSTWGGLWNTSWRTGVDEHGEPNHASMYKHLWSNGPKEAFELPDYTFKEHFGKPTPSFAPRLVVRDYLEGRWTRKTTRNMDLKTFIKFSTVVRWVKYDDDKQSYTVVVEDLETRQTREEIFTHIIVAVGIFNTPFLPHVPGMDDFNGRVVHSHDFRDAGEFKGQKVLIIGASYSGEDAALQLIKFQAKNIYLSYKTIPKSATCILPKEIEEKPLVVRMDAKKAYFTDGSEVEVDSVILCTGYKNHFPFLESRFRIKEETSLYPPDLYMGALFYKEGDNNLFYVGVQDQFYTFNYIEALAIWTCRYIMGAIPNEPKSRKEMDDDSQLWLKRVETVASESDVVPFQTAHIDALVEQSGYELQLTKIQALLYEWIRVRKETLGLANYRDHLYSSAYTGEWGLKQMPFMENFDDSLEAYLSAK